MALARAADPRRRNLNDRLRSAINVIALVIVACNAASPASGTAASVSATPGAATTTTRSPETRGPSDACRNEVGPCVRALYKLDRQLDLTQDPAADRELLRDGFRRP